MKRKSKTGKRRQELEQLKHPVALNNFCHDIFTNPPTPYGQVQAARLAGEQELHSEDRWFEMGQLDDSFFLFPLAQ